MKFKLFFSMSASALSIFIHPGYAVTDMDLAEHNLTATARLLPSAEDQPLHTDDVGIMLLSSESEDLDDEEALLRTLLQRIQTTVTRNLKSLTEKEAKEGKESKAQKIDQKAERLQSHARSICDLSPKQQSELANLALAAHGLRQEAREISKIIMPRQAWIEKAQAALEARSGMLECIQEAHPFLEQ